MEIYNLVHGIGYHILYQTCTFNHFLLRNTILIQINDTGHKEVMYNSQYLIFYFEPQNSSNRRLASRRSFMAPNFLQVRFEKINQPWKTFLFVSKLSKKCNSWNKINLLFALNFSYYLISKMSKLLPFRQVKKQQTKR